MENKYKLCCSVFLILLFIGVVSAGLFDDFLERITRYSPEGIGTVGGGYKSTPGSTIEINAHSVCKKVINSGGNTYFIPTKTSTEWSVFRSNPPSGISFGSCIVLPNSFDWRNKDGKNWMSPVKNQGSCGSCWAFSVIGPIEAVNNIKKDNPNLDIDLSEQELVSCSSAGSCAGGYTSQAISYIKNNNIRTEGCFPYRTSDYSCSPSCNTKYSITNYKYVSKTIEDIKNDLRTYGPLSICLNWADAIQFGSDGVGRCSSRTGTGGHCVTLVGYNDDGNYWIIKNSWGSWWRESGYGKVGYGECNIETRRSPIAILGVDVVGTGSGTWQYDCWTAADGYNIIGGYGTSTICAANGYSLGGACSSVNDAVVCNRFSAAMTDCGLVCQ